MRVIERLRPATSIVWDLNGLLFVEVPKVATRSMRAVLVAWLHGHDALEEATRRETIKRAAERYEHRMSPAKIRRRASSRFAFAFVRNPLDRLHSAYADKVLMPTGEGIFARHGVSPDTDFEEFVRIVAQLPDRTCDRHLRSQHRFVSDRSGVVVDLLGRFETIETDWRRVARRFGLPDLPRLNVTGSTDYQQKYTPEVAEIAAERYRIDIEMFGYEEEVAALTTEGRTKPPTEDA